MRPWLLNILTTFSLLLCVAVAALWVRSYWSADDWAWRTLHRIAGQVTEFGAFSARGLIRVSKKTLTVDRGFTPTPPTWSG